MHDRAAPAHVGTEKVPTPPRYRAFISYSHADTKWASWLMRRLESYRVSGRFHGRVAPIGEVGARIAPVFRDRDELSTTSDLGEAVRAALRESATLVVVCSPASAKSRWVSEEIVAFKRLHGETRVFAFIVAGEPKAEGTDEDCFSSALRRELGADGELSSKPAEVVAADARPEADGKEDAFIRLVAGLLGVGFDDLRRRELHRRHRRMTWIAVGSVAGMAITIGLAAVAIVARDDAERRQEQGEELLTFMLSDMKTRLQKADKLDALEEVGAKAMAYFQTLKPRELTDTTLARQASALTQIGEIRMAQLRYAEAETALKSAFERTAALAARHPTNGEILFERGQAEFGIGNMHRKRGEVLAMGEWFARYRDTCVALAKLDPNRASWQGELAYGLHNMAVYDLDCGRLEEARRGFLAELEILAKLAPQVAQDVALQFQAVDANSWLGTIEERTGNLAEAANRFARQVADLETIIKLEPRSAKWQAKLADALALRANMLAITDQRVVALECRGRANKIFATLIANDGKNRAWQRSLQLSRLKEARLLLAEGRGPDADKLVEEALAGLESLATLEPSDVGVAASLVVGLRLRAELLETSNRPGAAALLARAIEIGDRITAEGKGTTEMLSEAAKIHLATGRRAAAAGDAATATKHFQRALALAEPAGPRANEWQLLDAAARAWHALGQPERSAAAVQRLQRSGYQPFEPWPRANLSANP